MRVKKINKLFMVCFLLSCSSSCGNKPENDMYIYEHSPTSTTVSEVISSGNLSETKDIYETTSDSHDIVSDNYISAHKIMLNNNIYYIDTISPIDYLIEQERGYISVITGEDNYTEFLNEKNFIGVTKKIPDNVSFKNDLETDFFGNAEIYCDGKSAVLLLRYEESEAYKAHFEEDVIASINYQEALREENPDLYEHLTETNQIFPFSPIELESANVWYVYEIEGYSAK